MFKISKFAIASAVALTLVALNAPVAMAQSSDAAASSPATQPTKAQRKAARKTARTKKNAELKTLEKNGYHEEGDQASYPTDLQNAEAKAAAGKAKAASGQ